MKYENNAKISQKKIMQKLNVCFKIKKFISFKIKMEVRSIEESNEWFKSIKIVCKPLDQLIFYL